jgi:hypothetical protein
MAAHWQRSWLKSKDNALIFVRDVLGVTPEPWQAEALEAVGKHDRVSIRSGHGVGKTTLQAWLVLWFLLTHQNCKVPVAANSQDQLRDTIWPEIAKWHRQLPDALKAMIDVQAERIVVVQDPEGAFAVRRTASKDNPEALQGFHAEHLLFLIDEASGIPDVVFEVGMGALSTPGAKVLMAGNPTRASGFFFDTHHSLRSRWHTMHVSCLDVPRAQGHIEDIRAKYGEGSNAWRVRVLGEFPTAEDETVIPLELVLSAVGRNVSSLDYFPVWGVDVARFGDDRTALAKRQANKLLEPLLPDTPMFRNQKGTAYSKDALCRSFRKVLKAELPGDTRKLMDFRRSGSQEAQAGDVSPLALATKLANSISQSKRLQDTYLPKRAATVRLADEARKRGRQKLRAERPANEKLKLAGRDS